jgi:hypothetical protein
MITNSYNNFSYVSSHQNPQQAQCPEEVVKMWAGIQLPFSALFSEFDPVLVLKRLSSKKYANPPIIRRQHRELELKGLVQGPRAQAWVFTAHLVPLHIESQEKWYHETKVDTEGDSPSPTYNNSYMWPHPQASLRPTCQCAFQMTDEFLPHLKSL